MIPDLLLRHHWSLRTLARIAARVLGAGARLGRRLEAALQRVDGPPPQPHPIAVNVLRLNRGGQETTVIVRLWRRRSVPACRLCPRCIAARGLCVMGIPWHVPDAEVPLFRRPDAPAPRKPAAPPLSLS